jgi:Chlorophyll A-B binding protein
MSFNEENKVLGAYDLPGNFGFDPLHLAQSRKQLITYRKAEMKHARLAMLVSSMPSATDLRVCSNLVIALFLTLDHLFRFHRLSW